MGFHYWNLKGNKDNYLVWEKQEYIEIKQNLQGFYKRRRHSLIKQRFYEKTPKTSNNKNLQKYNLKKVNSENSSVTNQQLLNTLIWKQKEQQEFKDIFRNSKEQLQNLEQNLIECLLRKNNVGIKEMKNKMESKKKKKLEKQKESTWSEFLGDNKEIAKERYSLKHQCISTSPRYFDDKNLSPRPKMRSVASQVAYEEELLDQGAVGDHNSLRHIKSLDNGKDKSKISKEIRYQPIINCCYGLASQSTGTHNCQHYNYPPKDLNNKREYNYCQEEYYYHIPNCNYHKYHANCCQPTADHTRHYRRQNTDLNTQHFYSRPQDKLSSPERSNNKSKKRKVYNKSVKCKTKESYELYNERKKQECEERLEKLKQRTTKKQSSHSLKANDNILTKSLKLKQLLKEENAKKLIKYLDQYVEDHEKELEQDLKNLQMTKDSTTSTPNSTVKITSVEKYCQVKIKKQQNVSCNREKEFEESSSLDQQYSLKTLKMLKKMTIREYKPLKPQEKLKDKSHSEAKQLLEKLKNYQEYMQKFEKEKLEDKSVQILKSPPAQFPEPESEMIDITQKDILGETSTNKTQTTKEQMESIEKSFAEALTISQESFRDIPRNVTLQYPTSRDSFEILREHSKAVRTVESKPESLNDSVSYEEFKYEYDANNEATKTWDDYENYKEQNAKKYEAAVLPETGNPYRDNDSRTNIKNPPTSLIETESYKVFPNISKTQRRTGEFSEENKKYLHTVPQGYVPDFTAVGKDNILTDNTELDQENQRRLAILRNNIANYGRFESQKPKTKDLTCYKNKRKEVLETKHYSRGDLTKLEYKQTKYKEKYIQEHFKDNTIGNDQIVSKYDEKLRGSREKRSVAEKQHLSKRETEVLAPNVEAHATFYEDIRKDSREGNGEVIKGPTNDEKPRSSREKRLTTERDHLSKRESTIFAPNVDAHSTFYSSEGKEEQNIKYHEDKKSSVNEEETTKPRSTFHEIFREGMRKERLNYRDKRRSSAKDETGDSRLSFYGDKRSEFREEFPSATKEPTSTHYKDIKQDFRRETQAANEKQCSKFHHDKRRDFIEERQQANDPRYKNFKDKIGDHFEGRYGMTELPKDHNYEDKPVYYRQGRKALNDDFKRGDFSEREQTLMDEQSSKYYKDALEEKPLISTEQRSQLNDGKRKDSQSKSPTAKTGDVFEGRYAMTEEPKYHNYENKSENYREGRMAGDVFEERYIMTKQPEYQDKSENYREVRMPPYDEYKTEYFREREEPLNHKQISKYYEGRIRDYLEEKPLTSREPRSSLKEGKREHSKQESQIANEFPNLKYYEDKRKHTLEENYTINRKPKENYYEKSNGAERQTEKGPPSLKYNKVKEERPSEDLGSKYFKDKIRDSLMVKQPASNKQKSKSYEQNEDIPGTKYYKNERDFQQEIPSKTANEESKYYEDREEDLTEERKPYLQQSQEDIEYNFKVPQVMDTQNIYADDREDFREPTVRERRIQDNIDEYSPNEGSYEGNYRQLQDEDEFKRSYEFPIFSRAKRNTEYEQELPKLIEQKEAKGNQELSDCPDHERRLNESSVKFSLPSIRRDFTNDSLEQNQVPEISFKKEKQEYHMEELPRSNLESETQHFLQNEIYKQEAPEISFKKETQEYHMEELPQPKFEKETHKFSQNEMYKEETQNLEQDDQPEIDKKSQTSSYRDFKQVMDQNLGFFTNRHSQTDNTLDQELNEEQSQQTYNKKTLEINAASSVPTNTEQALTFLKNLIETSPQLGLKGECLNSVTSAAEDLITKLSSCQSSLQTEVKANLEQKKSYEYVTNYNLEEKSTPESQYKDLETPTDSNENQMKTQNICTIQAFQINEIQEMLDEPGDVKLLQQDSYHYQELITPQFRQTSETYESTLKIQDNLSTLIPPLEHKDEQQSCLPNESQNTTVYCENTQESLSLNADLSSIYRIQSCVPRLESNNNYRPLPSPRRLAAFDPALVPLKSILKPCREEEISEFGNCDLSAQRKISVVSFGNKDVINMKVESQTICHAGQEEIAQHVDETEETIITKDINFQPVNEETQYILTSNTSISQNICQECRKAEEVNINRSNFTHLKTPRVPPFKQCPCMFDTYKRMLRNYYQTRN